MQYATRINTYTRTHIHHIYISVYTSATYIHPYMHAPHIYTSVCTCTTYIHPPQMCWMYIRVRIHIYVCIIYIYAYIHPPRVYIHHVYTSTTPVGICPNMLHYTATHCTATRCNTPEQTRIPKVPTPKQSDAHVAVRCSVLQCVAVCCSVVQCGAACCSVAQSDAHALYLSTSLIISLSHTHNLSRALPLALSLSPPASY